MLVSFGSCSVPAKEMAVSSWRLRKLPLSQHQNTNYTLPCSSLFRAVAEPEVLRILLCIEYFHFDLIYKYTVYHISFSCLGVQFGHCLKPFELSRTEISCRVVRTAACGTNTRLQIVISPLRPLLTINQSYIIQRSIPQVSNVCSWLIRRWGYYTRARAPNQCLFSSVLLHGESTRPFYLSRVLTHPAGNRDRASHPGVQESIP